MDERPGRFNIGEGTMKIGTEIYRELIKKMLSVHIAAMERKMRACQRCPPRCPPVLGDFLKKPYTAPYKKLPFVPRSHLPSYVRKKLRKPVSQPEELRIRKSAQERENQLYKHDGRLNALADKIRQKKLRLIAEVKAMASTTPGQTFDRDRSGLDEEPERSAADRAEERPFEVEELRRQLEIIDADDQPDSEKIKMRASPKTFWHPPMRLM